MPYTSPATLSDDQVLTASHLNLLASDIAFLYGLINRANAPFNTIRDTFETFDRNAITWYVLHRVPYLHWRVGADTGWNYCRIYFNGVLVGESSTGQLFESSYNLASWAGLPHLLGAWVTGTAYEDDVHGNGNAGNGDDGHVVTQGGQYYKCILAHTSGATNQPGVGASWTTYWVLFTLPGLGTICSLWADVNFNTPHVVTVDYMIETDSASF